MAEHADGERGCVTFGTHACRASLENFARRRAPPAPAPTAPGAHNNTAPAYTHSPPPKKTTTTKKPKVGEYADSAQDRPLIDDIELLGGLLDDCLRSEVGEEVSVCLREGVGD